MEECGVLLPCGTGPHAEEDATIFLIDIDHQLPFLRWMCLRDSEDLNHNGGWKEVLKISITMVGKVLTMDIWPTFCVPSGYKKLAT